MKIRPATSEDCPQLAVLNHTVQTSHAESEPLLFKQDPDAGQVTDFFMDMLDDPDNHILILEEEGKAAGYLFLQIIRRPENAFMQAYSMIHIHHIAVVTEKQGSGYGTKLLEAACILAQEENIPRVVLDTWSFNTAAHKFFKGRGFKTFNLRMSKMLTNVA
jgi:ribosomal protein S18 acetylase RimI-like enzyme